MRHARLHVPPSLAIVKAKSIASTLSISDSDFKASWQWLSRFRTCRGLEKMLLHGKGAEVDKNDLELLSALEELYSIIAQYDLENIYNMDKTGLFFCLLPRYSILMPNEDISSIRGKKKVKDRVSLIVCANQRVLKTDTGQFLISIKRKHGWTWKPIGNGSTKSLFQKSKDEQDVPFSY